jgi:hypothetical protein
MVVTDWIKLANFRYTRKGGQGPTWTVEAVEREILLYNQLE